MGNQNNDPWHIKKEITWGHIMSTIVLAGALLTAWADMGSRIDDNSHLVAANAREIEHVKELDEVNKQQMKVVIQGLSAQYDKIDEKLDKIIDRELNGNH